MSEKTRATIDYIVVCANDFSDAHHLSLVDGFDYLKTYGGLAFLERNYDIEHTYSIDETVTNLTEVCRRNGGTIATMTPEVKQLIEFAIQDLVAEIVSRESLSIEVAMDKLYHSHFFLQLQDPRTGLYREGGAYLYAAFGETGGLS